MIPPPACPTHGAPQELSLDLLKRWQFAGLFEIMSTISVEIAAHGVPVEACGLKLAHDHAHVLLAEVLFAVTRNSDDDAGFVAKTPMARGLAAQFGKAVIC